MSTPFLTRRGQVAAQTRAARRRGALELSGLFGIGLMAWIVVQRALLTDRLWLQPMIFGMGAVITALAIRGRGCARTR